MVGIKVFISGSTHKNAQRYRDKARILLSKLQNKRFGQNEEEIAIYAHDFTDFKRQQEEYNKFIQDEADIFIALVDAKYDTGEKTYEKTYSEYTLACETYKKFGRPEIVILYKTAKQKGRPGNKWTEPLQDIDKRGRYVISKPNNRELLIQLQEELVSNYVSGGIIHKFLPTNPIRQTGPACKFKIGDTYDKKGVRGIIFEINETGKSGKIISSEPAIECSWEDVNKQKIRINPGWRIPTIEELENIIINHSSSLNCKKKKNIIFWSTTQKDSVNQRGIKWFPRTNKFEKTNSMHSTPGCIKPVKNIEF